jgi:hypothetical protein
VNRADPFEDAFTGYGYNWPVPRVYGDADRVPESGCSLLDTLYSGGIALASPPEMIKLTGSANSAATTVGSNITATTAGANITFVNASTTAGSNITATTAGANITFVNAFGDPSTIAMAGYGLPAPKPLAVRRFYHWNKSATAGAAGRPNGPQKEGVADTRPIPDVIVAEAYETVQVTESAAIQVVEDEAVQSREHARRRRLVRRTVLSPRSLTSVAVVLAGQKRSMVGEEWRGHLLGEHASCLTQREQTRAARGFVLAAVRYRAQDAANLAWRPADAVLGSRTLSNLFVWGPVIVMLVAIVHHDGRFGLVADVQDPLALGAFLYGVIRTGRWWRGVKPLEPKARRARE